MTDAPAIHFLKHEPAEAYHAQAKDNLSSHQLGNFRRAPLLYHKKRTGQIPDDDRPAYLVGRAAHTLILEGRKTYEHEFAVGGPVNPKTGEVYGSRTKAFSAWAVAQEKPVLTDSQAALIEQMAAAVAAHELAVRMLAEGEPEGVVRADYCGTPCQIRIDWFNPDLGIVDLKTCDDLTWFEADARRYGYAHQLAFYRSVLQQVTPLPISVYMMAVEKKEPFRCGVWRVGEDVLGIAKTENEEAIDRLKACQEQNDWPAGYEDMRTFDYL